MDHQYYVVKISEDQKPTRQPKKFAFDFVKHVKYVKIINKTPYGKAENLPTLYS